MTFFADVNIMQLALFWIEGFGYGQSAANTICILVLIIAIVIDIRNRISRDWLHWAGALVLFLVFAVEPIVLMIVVRFL